LSFVIGGITGVDGGGGALISTFTILILVAHIHYVLFGGVRHLLRDFTTGTQNYWADAE